MIRSPTALLWTLVALSLLAVVYEAAVFWRGLEPNAHLLGLTSVLFVLVLVLWVDADSRSHPEIYRPFEFGYLAFLFWLPYLPYYLWRTRGARGVALFVAFAALFSAGWWVQWLIHAVG